MEDLPADRPMKYMVDIESYLNDNGGLKAEAHLKDLLVFMKKAKKMAPRILLLLIIDQTDEDIQSKFCFSEGWNVLTDWLHEAKSETNESFIREILTVMMKLPVNVSVLRSNSCAKAVKQLAKVNPEVSSEVPKLAREVVIKWMSIINETFDTKSKEGDKTQTKKTKLDNQLPEEPPSKKRKKDKEKKRHDSSENEAGHSKKEKRLSADSAKDATSAYVGKHSDKHPDRHSDKHAERHFEKHLDRHSEKHERHSDKHSERHSDKHSERHSDKHHGEKHEKHSEKHSEKHGRKREREESPDTKQRKRATVKILPQRMRTAGIEEGGEKVMATKSRSEVLAAKKEKLEKPASEIGTAPSIESMHQKIKVSVSGASGEMQESRPGASQAPGASSTLNAKLRRPSHEIHESNSFMNALNAASVTPVVRKKKKPIGNAASQNKSRPETTSTGKADAKHAPEKEKEKAQNEDDVQSDGSNDSQGPKKSSMAEIGSLITKKAVKKTVTWADEDNLREVYYFELDETERINVNRLVSMEEMKRKEHLLERQNISRTLSTGNQPSGSGVEASPPSPYEKGWYRPMSLEGSSYTTEFGKNSREVSIQSERERHVLAALYFSKEDIPPSAKEPDTAHEDYVEPVIIPLEDQTIMEPDVGAGHAIASVEEKKGDKVEPSSPRGSPAASSPKSPATETTKPTKVLISENEKFTLTPEVASLLKSITAGFTDVKKDPEQEGEAETEAMRPSDSRHAVKNQGLLPLPNPASQQQPQQQQLQQKYSDDVWCLLKENYPQLNLDEPISVERMRQLLEPIQEQLRACGALNSPGGSAAATSQPFQRPPNSFPNGPPRPSGPQGLPPRAMHPGHYGPGPGGNGPPPQVPNAHNRPHHPPRPHGHPHHPQQRPHFPGYNNQGPRGYAQPLRMNAHRPPFPNNGPPPPFSGGSNGNGGGVHQQYRGGGGVCRFYQNGSCRSGHNCRFVHQPGGPPHSPPHM